MTNKISNQSLLLHASNKECVGEGGASNQSSVTQRSGTAGKCFHFSLKAAKRPTISFKHESVPKPQSWNRWRCSIMSYGETQRLQHKNIIDDLWSWGTSQTPWLLHMEILTRTSPKQAKIKIPLRFLECHTRKKLSRFHSN